MNDDVRGSYDKVAQEYVNRIYDELRHKPFDRKMLDWFAEKVGQSGTICDMGCGPGQIARYLSEQGISDVCGIDLSPEMVEHARHLNPSIPFQQGDMRALDVTDGCYGGIAAFYSIIHIPREEVVSVLREWKRVLVPGGHLLLAFHLGSEIRHLDEWWGLDVSIDFIFFEREEIKGYLQSAGFQLDEVIERDPYPDTEAQTRRAYLFARAG
jgi:SAM-dependent methyltransferase